MTSALPAQLRDPRQAIDGLAELMRRFAEDLGIAITYAQLPDHEVADLDGDTATLTLRTTAPLEHQLIALSEYWRYLAIGPYASALVHRQPVLRLVVPAPRDTFDSQLS
jgi:hypothetical protein